MQVLRSHNKFLSPFAKQRFFEPKRCGGLHRYSITSKKVAHLQQIRFYCQPAQFDNTDDGQFNYY